MDTAINTFFTDRKEAWLKKNLKASLTELEVKEKQAQCDEVFSLPQWLPNAAKRAGQISISTHPCTFSHPSSRKNKNGYASSIIAKSAQANDGFLRSGNVTVNADALGNAAALDVYKFLMLVMQDGQTLIQHLEQDTDLATTLLNINSTDAKQNYASLKQGFLAMTTSAEDVVTSSKIKQVYVPVDDDYHQLSTLTASGIVFDLRKRLDTMRFGDEIKQARVQKKAGKQHPDYKEISNLSTIAYGGTKPQNISVLNNQNGGKAHLFLSIPPTIKQRKIHFPTSNFFTQTAQYHQCRSEFLKLHALYTKDENNMHDRNKRDSHYQDIVNYIIEKMWAVRAVAKEQYYEASNHLSSQQKIWLCEHTQQQRETENDWLDDILKSTVSFLFHGYEKILGNKAFKFSDAEFKHMQQIVEQNKELLR